MNEDYMQSSELPSDINLEGLNEQEARAIKEALSRFMRSYQEKPEEQGDEAWLTQRFQEELPNLTVEQAQALSRETLEEIHQYDKNLASLKEARAKGQTTEEGFAEKSTEAASGLSTNAFGQRVAELDTALSQANAQMARVITTQSGAINQQWNLDGFLAEQHHVNSFNLAAQTSSSPFRAEVCVPGPGQTYGKNSFDVVIRDQSGHIVHQYQCKYGANAEATIQMIRRGNYNNQTLLVPPEQVEQVQAAFPGKTVVAQIGGTDKVGIHSEALTKAEAKELQFKAQKYEQAPQVNWSSFDGKMLTKYMGRQAAVAGVQGAAIATGFHLAGKLISQEPVDTQEVVSTALETGVDSGVKAAAAGAIKVASEKNLIGVIPPGTPVRTIADIACVAVENVKILSKAAKGEITMGEALEEMKCTTTTMIFGLSWGATGAAMGMAALSWIPVVGPVVGGVVGGTIGYMAGSKFGQKVYETAKKVKDTAKKAVRTVWEGAKSVGRKLGAGLKRLFS